METVTKNKSRLLNKPVHPPRNGHPQNSGSTDGLHLEPDMSFCDAGRAALAFRFKEIEENEGGTVRGEDPESLHDMRVATRRLRAALRDFRPAFGKKKLRRFEQDVRWLDDLLGRIRDLDVFIAWLKEYEESLPVEDRPYAHRVVEEREAARARERAALLAGLRSDRYREWKCNLQEFLSEQGAVCTRGPVMDLAVLMIGKELGRVHGKGKRVTARRLSRLHRLRIECKRLRYTAEVFSGLFPNHLERFIGKVKDLQDSLGTVHDSHIYAIFLGQVRRMQSADPKVVEVLNGMVRTLKEEQERAYRKFKKDYRIFDSKKYRRKVTADLRQTKKETE
jgi:CHAD domain-containing protein